jgi:hypothetical protein
MRKRRATALSRVLAALAAAAIAAPALAQGAPAERLDRRAAIRLVEHDLLREDSRVFRNRERGGEAVEASLAVGGARYGVVLQRPSRHEFLLVIEARDGARCPGLQTIVVGARSGRIYQGVCQASIGINHRTAPAYYEAELDRLLHLFHPLLAPHAPPSQGAS